MAERPLHVMAFGAHPVDAEITVGPVLAKYARAGHRATIVHLTLGEAGNPKLAPELYAEQKRREVAAAATVLGVDYRVLPYPDGDLPLTRESRLRVCDLLRAEQPDLVLTHWCHGIHIDHTNAYHLVMEAVRMAASERVQRELPPHRVARVYLAENWEDPFGFRPEVYVDVTDTYEVWLEAIQQHELVRGGIYSFPYLEYYQSLARVRGAEVGVRYAKAFMAPFESRRRVDFLPLE